MTVDFMCGCLNDFWNSFPSWFFAYVCELDSVNCFIYNNFCTYPMCFAQCVKVFNAFLPWFDITCVLFCLRGKSSAELTLLFLPVDCRICVWNASDGSLVHSLIGHTESVSVLIVVCFQVWLNCFMLFNVLESNLNLTFILCKEVESRVRKVWFPLNNISFTRGGYMRFNQTVASCHAYHYSLLGPMTCYVLLGLLGGIVLFKTNRRNISFSLLKISLH